MDIMSLKSFLKWCTIINGLLLLLSILVSVSSPDMALELHSRLFQIPRESVSGSIYLLLGTYKMLWLVFNLVPYLALTIVAKNR